MGFVTQDSQQKCGRKRVAGADGVANGCWNSGMQQDSVGRRQHRSFRTSRHDNKMQVVHVE